MIKSRFWRESSNRSFLFSIVIGLIISGIFLIIELRSSHSKFLFILFLLSAIIAILLVYKKTVVTRETRLIARLNEAQRIAKIGNWELDLQRNSLYWSDEIFRIFEIDQEKFGASYESFLDLVHPEDREAVHAAYTGSLETKKPYEISHRLLMADGRIKFVREQCETFYTLNGKPLRSIGTVQDITDIAEMEIIKKAQDSLLESEERYRRLAEDMPIFIATFLPSGILTYVNKTLAASVNLPPSALIGKSFFEFLSPEDRKMAQERLALLTPEQPFESHEQSYPGPVAGQKVYHRWTNRAFFDSMNRIVGFQAVGEDITAVKEAERVVLKIENEKTFRSLIDELPHKVWSATVEGKIDFVNLRTTEYFKCNFEEVIDLDWSQLVHPVDLPEYLNSMKKSLLTGEFIEFEFRLKNAEDQFRWHFGRVVPLKDQEGGLTRWLGVFTDIHDRKHAEEQLIQSAKLASLGEMSSGVAHEINNPLMIISGSLGLLSKYANHPEKLSEKIGIIKDATNRIAKIVSGLKKYSRNSEVSVFKIHDLSEIIIESIFLTEINAKQAGVQVTYEHKKELLIHCDEIEIEQVLINLINNSIDAVKNSSEKWVKVDAFENDQSVFLRVTDSGKGIPKETQVKLFDPFFTTKVVGEGTGLGLSITKGILEEHKATIELLENTPNTSFEIRFPKI